MKQTLFFSLDKTKETPNNKKASKRKGCQENVFWREKEEVEIKKEKEATKEENGGML